MARPKAFDRDKALILAMQLFWRKGYAATSVEDLVEALHLSRSSLYDTFGDKRALFIEALTLYSGIVTARIGRTLKEAESARVGIQAIFDELAAGVGSENGERGCFMVNSVAELVPYDPDVSKIAAEYGDMLQGLFKEALQRGATQPTVTSRQTPEQLAVYVFNVMQGLRVLIKAGAMKAQIEAIAAITLQSLP